MMILKTLSKFFYFISNYLTCNIHPRGSASALLSVLPGQERSISLEKKRNSSSKPVGIDREGANLEVILDYLLKILLKNLLGSGGSRVVSQLTLN